MIDMSRSFAIEIDFIMYHAEPLCIEAIKAEQALLEISEDGLDVVPFIRCTKGFSKKGKDKNSKIRFMSNSARPADMKSALNLYFCKE